MSQLPSPPLGTAPGRGLSERFHRLAAEWKEQSRFLSNPAQMAMLRPYQRIIGMGLPDVPLILEELRHEPDHWFWARGAITEQDPVPPEALDKVRLMAQAWVEWGEEQGSSRMRADREFPRLTPQNHRVTSAAAIEYNGIAWAAGDAENGWQPGVFWPVGSPTPLP